MRRTRLLLFGLVLILGLVAGSTAFGATGDDAVVTDGGPRIGVIGGASDFTIHGTGWTPERRAQFSQWAPKGWGTNTRIKAVADADQWVHIPVPFPTYIDDEAMKVVYVEFCAKSTRGAYTKPVTMDLWDNGTRFESMPISWPADNAMHCIGKAYNPAVWRSTLGISVLLHFANSTDQITLYKAWVQVVP